MKKLLLLLGLTMAQISSASTEMTLYFIPSPTPMDWSTPANLAMSALKNKLSFKSRFMGHVFVELKCGADRELTGMVGRNFDYLNQVIIEGRGLGVLYHSFDGKLEEAQDVDKEIAELAKTGERLNFVRFILNNDQCQRGMSYIKEYREKNVGRYYGLANRPLYGEGAGCSAFGASFAEVTGVLDTELTNAWSQTVNLPLAYSGPPLKDEKVNILSLMMNAQSWAKPSEPQQTLMFWSPDRMYSWVKDKISKSNLEKQFSVISIDKAQGIVFDKSHLPAPSGPIWQQHLDENIKKN